MKKQKVYLYDGTFDGLLCCIYHFYKDRDPLAEICIQYRQSSFFLEEKKIVTNTKNAQIVSDAICQKISQESLYDIYYAFLSDKNGKEMAILDYVRMGFRVGKAIRCHLTDRRVKIVLDLRERTVRERHRMLGLLRFQRKKNVLYARIEPDCDILPLIHSHFQKRISSEYWVIHDTKRNKAVIYDKKVCRMVEVSKDEIIEDKKDDYFEVLWKIYHKKMAISERRNLKLQMAHMPKKYWKNLTELQEKSVDNLKNFL